MTLRVRCEFIGELRCYCTPHNVVMSQCIWRVV